MVVYSILCLEKFKIRYRKGRSSVSAFFILSTTTFVTTSNYYSVSGKVRNQCRKGLIEAWYKISPYRYFPIFSDEYIPSNNRQPVRQLKLQEARELIITRSLPRYNSQLITIDNPSNHRVWSSKIMCEGREDYSISCDFPSWTISFFLSAN